MALAGAGTGSSALAIGGSQPGNSALTEEWNVPSSISNVTVASS